MFFDIPTDVLEIVRRLETNGHEAFLVGGCVRDSLLHKQPSDYDIATDATPDAVSRIFSGGRLLHHGAKHGTVGIVTSCRVVEVTTYRVDGKYSDSRRPDSVVFTRSLREDLIRRDFTVNALAYNPASGLVDVCGGREDLAARIVRCVGEPGMRYGEDALRILRAFRFSSTLDFGLERETELAANKMRSALNKISRERIRVEIEKLLMGEGAARVLPAAREVILTCVPEFSRIGRDAYDRMCVFVGRVPRRPEARLAAFFLPLEQADLRRAIWALRFSGEQSDSIHKRILAFAHDLSEPTSLKKALGQFGLEAVLDALYLREAHGEDTRPLREMAREIILSGACVSVGQLAVDGRDVIGLGVAPGKEVGRILSALLDGVIAGAYANEREALLGAIRTFI